MTRRILAAVFFFFAASMTCLAESGQPVHISDDFSANTLKSYRIEGGVIWKKGQVALSPGSKLTRHLGFDPYRSVVELKLVLRLPCTKHGNEVMIRPTVGSRLPQIILRTTPSQSVLINAQSPTDVVNVGQVANALGETAWVIRLELRYGLVRSKAWRKNEREPLSWQSWSYSGHWKLSSAGVEIQSGVITSCVLEFLEIVSTNLSLKTPTVEDEKWGRVRAIIDEIKPTSPKTIHNVDVATQHTIQAFHERSGPDHILTVIRLTTLSAILEDLGKHAEAIACLEDAVAICKRVVGTDHPVTAAYLDALGEACQARHMHAEARRLFGEAGNIRRKTLDVNNPEAAKNAVPLLGEGYSSGSATYSQKLLNAAYLVPTSFDGGPTCLVWSVAEQRVRWLSNSDRWALLELTLNWKRRYGSAISDRLELYALTSDDESKEMLRRIRIKRKELANLSTPRIARELFAGVSPRSVSNEPSSPKRETLLQELDQLEHRLSKRVGIQALSHEAPVALKHLTNPRAITTPERQLADDLGLITNSYSASDMAKQLRVGDAYIEFIKYAYFASSVAEKAQKQRYAALLLSRSKGGQEWVIQFIPLGDGECIDEVIHKWRNAALRGGVGSTLADQAVLNRIWRPLATYLPKATRRLLIVPDGELTLLPFQAIRFPDGKFLIESYQIRYLSSGRDLAPRPRPRKSIENLAVVLANPDFDTLGDPPVSLHSMPPSVPKRGDPAASDRPSRATAFKPLPGFVREADSVTRLLQSQPEWKLQVFRGAQASEETLGQFSGPRILYFITHGFFLPVAASFSGSIHDRGIGPPTALPPKSASTFGDYALSRSGLALAGANRWKERSEKGLSDGLLTALEVENLDLWNTELVILSCCETGLGEFRVGEGVLGLRRAFQLAGARTVIASLWKVPDQETEQLMTCFLKTFLAGQEPAEALRKAQLDLIAQLRRNADPVLREAPPRLWAGFICHGRSNDFTEGRPGIEIPQEIKDLTERLTKGSIKDRIKAANRLAEYGEKAQAAARALCIVATASDTELRDAALDALENVQGELAKPVSTLLVDPRNHRQAARELGSMGKVASPAIPVLLWHAQQIMKTSAVYSDLRNPGNRGRIPKNYRDPTDAIRRDIEALTRIGPTDPDVVRALIAYASVSNTIALKALGDLTENSPEVRKQIVKVLVRVLTECEKGLKDPGDAPLADYVFPGIELFSAIEAVTHYGADAIEATTVLKALKRNWNETVRKAASDALDKLGAGATGR